MIRIAIADDLPVVRSGLRKFLSAAPDMVVVGEAGNGLELLATVAEMRPDIILMDVEMPQLDGVATTKQLRSLYPQIQVILLTMFDHDQYVFEGLKAGAVSYLLKDADDDEIIRAIRSSVQGESVLHPRAATKVVNAYTQLATMTEAATQPLIRLTPREQEILLLVARGLSNPAIARRLILSEGTVKNHVTNILAKLDVPSRTEAVLQARKLGII